MKLLFTFFILLAGMTSFAHRGNFLAINDVEITETNNSYIYTFQVENINMVEVRDIKIEFVVNRKSVFQKYYPMLKANHVSFTESFEIPKQYIDLKRTYVQIEITEIFGTIDDWGGWDSPNMLRQVNTLASEFYVEAPWRMKKTNASGVDQAIPLHFFLHDADEVVGTSPQIDYVEISVKGASQSSFGPILSYNNISTTDYHNMFTCRSETDTDLDVESFGLGDFSASSNYTIDFDVDSDWLGGDYKEVSKDFWFFTFNIPASDLVGLENVVDVKITVAYDNLTFTDDVFGVRVFRSDDEIPNQSGYYRGDTHLHSMFTQNDAEIGLPLCATKEAGKLIGLDWITTTDHTSDFDNYGDGNIHNNWSRIQSTATQMNSEDASLIYIAGQEVAANNHEGKLVHMLAYPSYSAPSSLPFLGDGDGDISGTSVSVNDALLQLNNADGFAFSAHPYATEDKLPLIPVDGGIWNLGEPGFNVNADFFPETGGEIICNDPNAPSDVLSTTPGKLIKDALKGSQIWNHRASLSVSGTSGDELDAWGVKGGITPMSQADTAGYGFHLKKFRQGQEIVNYINQTGLSLKNQDSTYQNWKMYFSAGADAHGSFNFSNTGNFAGFGGIDNNAVGKLSTIAYCPNGMGANGENVLRAMYDGNISLSDGPILTMGVSNNGNDSSNEILMGEDDKVQLQLIDDYYMNFNYTTTAEFGDITRFTFIVGTETGEVRKVLTLPSTSGDNQIAYKLTDILDSVVGYANLDLESFFYVRAELQTFRSYSSQVSAYRTDHDFFHSFTNPIWLKISEELDVEVTEFELESYPNPFDGDFTLIIKNPGKEDVMIGFYNDIGQLVYSEKVYVDSYKSMTFNAKELGLANGMYTIRAVIRDKSAELKVIKY